MSSSANFVQAPGLPTQTQPKPWAPVLAPRFLVVASSPDCNCVVTVTGDINGVRRAINVHKCKGHEEIEQKLAVAAHQKMQELIAKAIAGGN